MIRDEISPRVFIACR